MSLDPPISPSEVETLRRLDRECRSYHAKKSDEPKQSIGETLQSVKDAHQSASQTRK